MRTGFFPLALALALGCQRSDPPELARASDEAQVLLAGMRYVDRGVPAYGPLDRLRVHVSSPAAYRLRWSPARGVSAILKCEVSSVADGTLLSTPVNDLAPGPGQLSLLRGERTVWTGAVTLLGTPGQGAGRFWGAVQHAKEVARVAGPAAAADAWTKAAGLTDPHHSEYHRRWIASAHYRTLAGQLTMAAEALGRGAAPPVPKLQVGWLQASAILNGELGRYRLAESQLGAAESLARRFGMLHAASSSRETLALLMDALGRASEGLRLLDKNEPLARETGGTMLGRWQLNRGWLLVRQFAQDRGDPKRLAEARSLLTQAHGALAETSLRANPSTNLAWLEFLANRPDATARHLATAERLDPSARGPEWGFRTWLRGQIELQRGDSTAALRYFDALASSAPASLPDGGDLGWRARFGQGQALDAQGDARGAERRFGEALRLLERVSRRAALRGRQATFLDSRRDLVDAALSLQLRKGDRAAAFAVADQARARLLQGQRTRQAVTHLSAPDRARWLQAKDLLAQRRRTLEALEERVTLSAGAAKAWLRTQLAAARAARDEAADAALAVLGASAQPDAWAPPALAADEALLEARRLRAGWVVFLVRPGGVYAQRDPPDLLQGWGARLSGVRHLYVVPGGHPKAGALEVAFGDRGVVSWLPAGTLLARRLPPPGSSRLAAVDPDGTLPSDRALGPQLASRPHDQLLVGAQVTRAAFLAGLSKAAVVYFGGHGVLDRARPWDAHLRLADDQRLDVTDALMAHSPGAVVFLNGCETGPVDTFQRSDVLGLPEAFLVAGARSVVAAERPIPDQPATRFARAFFDAGGATAPAKALHAVRGRLRAAGDPIWDAYHLFGRR